MDIKEVLAFIILDIFIVGAVYLTYQLFRSIIIHLFAIRLYIDELYTYYVQSRKDRHYGHLSYWTCYTHFDKIYDNFCSGFSLRGLLLLLIAWHHRRRHPEDYI